MKQQLYRRGKRVRFYYIFIVFCLYLFSSPIVSAQYYQYTDKNGVKHFTDTLSDVPQDQRPGMNIFPTSTSSPEKKAPPKEPEETVDTLTLESLMIQKKTLDKEYEDIMKQKAILLEQKQITNEKQYNQMARQFNLEVNQYQEKKESFDMLVEQYNEQIDPLKNPDDIPIEKE